MPAPRLSKPSLPPPSALVRASAPPSGAAVVSLGTKLAVVTVVVLMAVSAVLFVQLAGRERRSLVDAKSKAATMTADLFAAGLAAPIDFDDDDGIQRELENLKSNAEITCASVWSGKAGKPGAARDRGKCGGRTAPPDDALGKTIVGEDTLEVARAVKNPAGETIGRTLLVFSLARENAEFVESQRQIAVLSFALAAATALLLIAASRRLLVRPLRQLSSAARRIGRGEYGTKVDVGSRDEMGELAHAFNAMREALADRESRLEAATQNLQDLFDHMRQAIVAFDVRGRVTGEASRQATKLFGEELEGKHVREVLYGGADEHDVDAQAFGEWLSMIQEVSLDGWPELEELAPKEVLLKRGRKSIPLELEFRPVVKGNVLDKVMLLATDVSEKRQLEQAVQTQEEEHARRMAAMRRLIAGGGQVFVSFIDSARDRFKRCSEIVGDGPRTLPIAEIDELFRHVHTVKGEARAFDLRELEAECAKLEEELDELRSLARGGGFATTGSVHGQLRSRLERATLAIEKGCDVFVAASPIGRAALDQVTVQRSDVEELSTIAETTKDRSLSRVVERLAARPFGESTASLIDMTPTWGDKEGKKVHLEVDGREVRVPPKLARVLPGVLTHLVRNAVAHGIEAATIRTQHGKPPGGTIHATAREHEAGVAIVVEDDGRGLDMARIEERATALGARVADTSPGGRMELVFVPGLSTSETAGALAGRGVGLAAVRSDLERAGYVIHVYSTPGKGTRFEIAPA